MRYDDRSAQVRNRTRWRRGGGAGKRSFAEPVCALAAELCALATLRMSVTNIAAEVPVVVWFVVPQQVEIDGCPDNAARHNVPGNLTTVVESDDSRPVGILSGRIEAHRPVIAPGS